MKRKMAVVVPATARTPTAIPTPIPALAPALRPDDGLGSEEETADGLVAAEVVVPVAAEVVVRVVAVAEVEEVEVLEVMAGL